MQKFDYIIIGSGFGGSVMSLRLVQKGYQVALLERGKKWEMNSFPRRIADVKKNLFWNPRENQFGYMEILNHSQGNAMTVTSSGLGGGSLIYANVLLPMKAESFSSWPRPYSLEQLSPFYEKVTRTMEASPYPIADGYYSETPKTKAFESIKDTYMEVGKNENISVEYIRPPLAIRFKGEFPMEQGFNESGALQSKCNKCGECDIGCNIHAKNSLDLNYLHQAMNGKVYLNPLTLFTDSEVVEIQKNESGYSVTYTNTKDNKLRQTLQTQKVILSAGSLGSTGLLLKMKKNGILPLLSDCLGKKWCGNGDLLGFNLRSDRELEPSHGPVITNGFRFSYPSYGADKKNMIHDFCIQDAGYPVGFGWFLAGKLPSITNIPYWIKFVIRQVEDVICRFFKLKTNSANNLGTLLANTIDDDRDLKTSLVLLGMGQDRSDGEIRLDSSGNAQVVWNIDESRVHFERITFEMKRISKMLRGYFFPNPLTPIDKVISVHPLGGCAMAASIDDGVVDFKGEVFNYPGLYVVDGSILPTSTGANPALTIAAVAEFISDNIPMK